MDVCRGDPPAGTHLDVDRQQLAVSVRGGADERQSLAGDWIVDALAGGCHHAAEVVVSCR